MSSLKLWKNKIVKISRFFLVFAVITAWLFTGWPQIWQNPRIPPKIQEVRAASPEVFVGDGTFTASTGIYSVTVACWGGGGGGGIVNTGGGGGGGGAYAASTVSVIPGTGYAIVVGAGGLRDTAAGGGDSTFAATVVVADGGLGTTGIAGGVGGTVANSTGDVEFAGGTGGIGLTTNDTSGGGGGAGGPAGAGNNGVNAAATVGGAGGSGNAGSGGAGGTAVDGQAGGPGGNHATGGGGGGGADTNIGGGVGGAPGGGGGGSENAASSGLGAAGQCIITYTDTWAPSTALATYSNTWSFATAPANDSASQISMTATTGYDYTTPINYLFTLNNSGCGTNAGTGGTTSSWQSSTSYSDSLLDPNKCYGYTVTARDSVATPNTGTASSISSTYTSANTPGTPTLNGATLTSLNLTNAENGNPASNPTTNFAVQVTYTSPSDATWLDQWVDASGNPSATAVWLTDAQLDALVLQGLNYGTTYGVKVKAKNEDGDETSLSAEGQGTTTAAIYSVAITPDEPIAYGTIVSPGSKSTLELAPAGTKIAQNDGNITEKLSIKTTNASGGTGWTIGSSAGVNIFVHEFSSNGGGAWTKFTTADNYQPLVGSLGVGSTQPFDLRITVPTDSDAIEKSITVTILAEQL